MDMMSCFNGMFGKLGAGMCRLTMNGKIAVKTSGGYKSYNVKTGKLTNCSNFVFDIGDDFFFVIPTNKVDVGDIILIKGRPQCVISVDNKVIEVLNYEDMTIDRVVPERHVFMGNTYFYGKIVSMMGATAGKGAAGMKKMMSFMVMSQMMNGNTGVSINSNMSNMLPMMLMMGGEGGNMFDGMLDGIFDFGSDNEDTTNTADVDEEEDEE